MYDVPAGVGHELLAAKGQGHGSDADAGLNVMMLHLLSTLNGERTVVVELDNAADQHNNAYAPFAVALVDFGLVDRAVFVFLAPYHAKHLADGAHGALRTAARMADVLDIDGLSMLSNRLPGHQSSIINTATFVDFPAAFKEVYRAKTIPNIKQYSIFAADREMAGTLSMKTSADDPTWYSFVVRPPEMNETVKQLLLAALRRKPAQVTKAASNTIGRLGPNAELLREQPGFRGMFMRQKPEAYQMDGGECLPANYVSRMGSRNAALDAWQVREWLQQRDQEAAGDSSAPAEPHAADAIPILAFPYGVASSQLAGLALQERTALDIQSDIAWALTKTVTCGATVRAASRTTVPSSAPKHQAANSPYGTIAAELIRVWETDLSKLEAQPAPVTLLPINGIQSLSTQQKEELKEFAK